MNRTKIEWSNFTSNPLRYRDKDGNVVHACIHASTGCLKCYSEAMAGRWGRAGKKFTAANMEGLTPFLDEKELHSILTYKPAAGQMCFLGDMTDIFGQWVPFELIDQLFAVMALRPDVTFQLLTKRAERMWEYCVDRARKMSAIRAEECPSLHDAYPDFLPNLWLGTSVENQKYADERIPLLLQTPAAVRFVSYEPAIEPVNFDSYPGPLRCDGCGYTAKDKAEQMDHGLCKNKTATLDWIIVGGESGNGARYFDVRWARSVIEQCRNSNVACFVKQLGSKPQIAAARQNHYDWGEEIGRVAHFERSKESDQVWDLKLKDRKGGDTLEWAEELRVRQFPAYGIRNARTG